MQLIPEHYTCDGDDHNPPLAISDVPIEAKSLALIVDDPDSPTGLWTHWAVWNIPAETQHIVENSLPYGAVEGINDFHKTSYGGPCPGSGLHRYFFRLYAVDTVLNLPEGASRADLERMISGHVLALAELIGTYQRQG